MILEKLVFSNLIFCILHNKILTCGLSNYKDVINEMERMKYKI